MNGQQVPAQRRIRNLTLAAIAGQAGCATLVIVLSALFIGLWLDSQSGGQRGLFTFGLLIASVPVSLYVMLRLTLGALNRIQPPPVITHEDTPDPH